LFVLSRILFFAQAGADLALGGGFKNGT